jgi:Xaa-Pro aminopeptidase
MSQFAQRRNKLRKLIKKSGAAGMLVTNEHNVTYLTGFTGDSSYLLIAPKNEVMLSDSRYTVQLEEECPDVDVDIRNSGQSMLDAIDKQTKRAKVASLAMEADSLTVSTYGKITENFSKLDFVNTSGLVEQLREIKDKDEIASLRRAVDMAERTFAVIRASLRPNQTEQEIAANIEHQIRQFGGKGCSFTPIVGVGPRAALPHAIPTERQIGESDFVLIDWGANEHLYMSDLTRVLVTGKISPKLERIYKVVLKAQEQAIAAIRPGALMSDVDAIARNIIKDAGFGKNFGHGLGHGIGLEIHEVTRLASNQHREFKAGMVVTVEPGIYIPGWGGVRIEDDILVTRNGHDVLSSVPKDFESTFVGCN